MGLLGTWRENICTSLYVCLLHKLRELLELYWCCSSDRIKINVVTLHGVESAKIKSCSCGPVGEHLTEKTTTTNARILWRYTAHLMHARVEDGVKLLLLVLVVSHQVSLHRLIFFRLHFTFCKCIPNFQGIRCIRTLPLLFPDFRPRFCRWPPCT